MKFKYSPLKHDKLSKDVNYAFTRIKKDDSDKKDINPTEKGKKLGIATTILYILLFFWIYGSAFYNKKINFDNFSLSRSFEFCEKRFATILIVITTFVFSYFLKEQNITGGNDSDRTIIYSVVYLLMMGLLLLFVVPTKESALHLLVTVLMIISLAVISSFLNKVYHKYYDEKSLTELKISSYICIFTICSAFFILFIRNILNNLGIFKLKYDFYISKIFYISEIIVIISFCATLAICSTYPPLIDDDKLICVINESTINEST